jgi:simple sugar transport system substrate-binding protein
MRNRLLLAVVALALLAAACGDDDDASDDTTATTAAAAATTTAAPAADLTKVALILGAPRNDLGWAQAGYEGASALADAGLIDLEVIEAGEYETSAVTRVLTPLLDEGFELILAHSFSFGDALFEIAPDNPEVGFAWAGGIGPPEGTDENIADYDQPFYQASYLAGILAAGVTETGILGGTSGFEIPVCHAQLEAFVLGAQEILPEAKAINTIVGSWTDAVLTKEAALAVADQGADVFMSCGVPEGTFEAVRERDLGMFSYVVDQSSLAPEQTIGSMIWDLSVTYGAMVEDIEGGTFMPGKYYQDGVTDGALRIDLNPAYAGEISAEAMAKYEEVLAAMQDGSFEAPYVPFAE